METCRDGGGVGWGGVENRQHLCDTGWKGVGVLQKRETPRSPSALGNLPGERWEETRESWNVCCQAKEREGRSLVGPQCALEFPRDKAKAGRPALLPGCRRTTVLKLRLQKVSQAKLFAHNSSPWQRRGNPQRVIRGLETCLAQGNGAPNLTVHPGIRLHL